MVPEIKDRLFARIWLTPATGSIARRRGEDDVYVSLFDRDADAHRDAIPAAPVDLVVDPIRCRLFERAVHISDRDCNHPVEASPASVFVAGRNSQVAYLIHGGRNNVTPCSIAT